MEFETGVAEIHKESVEKLKDIILKLEPEKRRIKNKLMIALYPNIIV